MEGDLRNAHPTKILTSLLILETLNTLSPHCILPNLSYTNFLLSAPLPIPNSAATMAEPEVPETHVLAIASHVGAPSPQAG